MRGHQDIQEWPFDEIWCVDFEFRADSGELPWPVCMVALELKSGREVKVWRDELMSLRQAPFNTGPAALFVAFFNSAEIGCFLELDWPLPGNILDLFVEHRVETNGLPTMTGNSLLGALAYRGLPHIDAVEKDTMRDLICGQTAWTEGEKHQILDYCASDVRALAAPISSNGALYRLASGTAARSIHGRGGAYGKNRDTN